MNIAEIILLLSAIFSAIVAYVFYREARKNLTTCEKWRGEFQDAKIKLTQHELAAFDYQPLYGIQKVSFGNYDRLAVVRGSLYLGVTEIQAIIKVFTDDDEEYNQRCAEELLEKLTERTTTDN